MQLLKISVQLLPQEVCNLKIIAHFSIGKTVYKINKYMIMNLILIPIAGPSPNYQQDSFMYRVQNGVRSFQLDDDNCDCYTTLSMGHGMCGSGFSTSYGPSGRFGVDLLYDTHCQTPDPKHSLSLYFRGIIHKFL